MPKCERVLEWVLEEETACLKRSHWIILLLYLRAGGLTVPTSALDGM